MMDEQRPGKRLRTEDEPRASGGSAPAGGGSAASGGGGTATPTKANTMASLRTTLGPRYEAAVEPLLEQPQRAPRVHELAVHASLRPSLAALTRRRP